MVRHAEPDFNKHYNLHVLTRLAPRSRFAHRTRTFTILLVLMCSGAASVVDAQFQRRRGRRERSFVNPNTEQALPRMFPKAGFFSPVEGTPPHITIYTADPRASLNAAPIGYAFWTTDLVPNEIGYHGPIRMLVGMNTTGLIAGVVVDADTEPYGYFSVETPEFSQQFVGKSVREPFRVGADVDAVSRASLTINSATRAIRDSSRMIARALLKPTDVK